MVTRKIKIPKNIQKILLKLRKNEREFGEFCIKQTAEALKANGYTDAHIWATTLLPSVLGELEYVENLNDMEEWILELDGMERDVVESIYDTIADLNENLKGVKQGDIKETIVFSISRALENIDKEKFKKLYG